MASFTRYLAVKSRPLADINVQVSDFSPVEIAQTAVEDEMELRYSPIMPAFLTPEDPPPKIPEIVVSIAFFFSATPYRALGAVKPLLDKEELQNAYFTEGLASILLLNADLKRGREICIASKSQAFEYWTIKDGKLDVFHVVSEVFATQERMAESLKLPSSDEQELAVYVEQISASLASLWFAYGIYLPEERNTIGQLSRVADSLIRQYTLVKDDAKNSGPALARQKKANATISALVELSATLSYAVAQGISGATPILWNHSPFPHHSLLGVGGSVRALTKFTRYLESAFTVRSAGKVIANQFSVLRHDVPASISKYTSGENYKFVSESNAGEYFDTGGDFRQDDHVPLVTYFSLRHGFMESKFSVTAASESLTSETMPQWTLMTLSHEIMHSRVRTIFQALFGKSWSDQNFSLISEDHYQEFAEWIERRGQAQQIRIDTGIRNVILNFCYAIEAYNDPVLAKDEAAARTVSIEKLTECYARHKQLAIEIVVHFHDYYFSYAYQPKMYLMSLWASWIKVAAPFTRTIEYLTRSLATVACGIGLEPIDAYAFSVDVLLDALDALEAKDVRSPLFDDVRRLVATDEVRALFKPLYYLVDQVRLFFASPMIASRIDRIAEDPFAEGSTQAEDYSANIYVFGEESGTISPIRYSLAALFRTLSDHPQMADRQWLTAWNYMVISS